MGQAGGFSCAWCGMRCRTAFLVHVLSSWACSTRSTGCTRRGDFPGPLLLLPCGSRRLSWCRRQPQAASDLNDWIGCKSEPPPCPSLTDVTRSERRRMPHLPSLLWKGVGVCFSVPSHPFPAPPSTLPPPPLPSPLGRAHDRAWCSSGGIAGWGTTWTPPRSHLVPRPLPAWGLSLGLLACYVLPYPACLVALYPCTPPTALLLHTGAICALQFAPFCCCIFDVLCAW